MGGFSLDPAVGAFLQSLSNAGLSQSQIASLSLAQGDTQAWGDMYSAMLFSNKQNTQQQDQQAAAKASADRDAGASLQSLLDQYFDPADAKSLGKWAKSEIAKGAGQSEILNDLRARPEYKKRFKGMELRRANGYSAISEADYVQYENSAKRLMTAANLPPGFYDQHDDFADFIGKNISMDELTSRVDEGYQRVHNADGNVRAQFAQWYGADGDTALAMLFLDSERSLPLLEKYVNAGFIGGYGDALHINIDKARAERLTDLGVGADQAQGQFAKLAESSDLFTETATEQTDFAIEEEGVDAAFGLDPEAEKMLSRRLDERTSADRGGGGAMFTGAGSGIGSSS